MMRKALAGALVLSLLFSSTAFAQNLSGTYVLREQGNTITIVLNQDAQGKLSGSMSSTTGAQFRIDGMMESGIGVGVCVGDEGGSYFEAEIQGNELSFTIIGADANNQPDYNNMAHLTFMRQGSGGPAMPSGQRPQMGGAGGQMRFPRRAPQQAPQQGGTPNLLGSWQAQGQAGTASLVFKPGNVMEYNGQPMNYTLVPGAIRTQGNFGPLDYPYTLSGNTLMITYPQGYQLQFVRIGGGPATPGAFGGGQPGGSGFGGQQGGAGQASLAPNEICNPNWRFKFVPPPGWKKIQEDSNIVMLGNESVIGVIMVFSHTMSSLDQVRADMQKGISSGGIILSPSVPVRTVGTSVVIAELQGSHNGQPARAHAMGTLTPNGGGAYIMCISPAEQFTPQLSNATDAIGAELQYFPPGMPNPMQQAGAGGYNQPMQQHPYGGGQTQPQQQPGAGGYGQPQQSGVGPPEVVRHFCGTWKNMTENSETTITLAPDGTFHYGFESVITGSSLSKYGGPTTDFGTASQDSSSGRWSIKGTMQQGVITYINQDGSRESYPYQVHVKNGQPYWSEYLINGVLYFKSN